MFEKQYTVGRYLMFALLFSIAFILCFLGSLVFAAIVDLSCNVYSFDITTRFLVVDISFWCSMAVSTWIGWYFSSEEAFIF